MTQTNNRIVSVFVIATNAYTNYAMRLITSAQLNIGPDTKFQFLVLTDQIHLVRDANLGSEHVEIQAFQIPSYGWPEATLLRFHLMLEHWKHIKGNIVVYLDADTEIAAPLQFSEFNGWCRAPHSNGISLVLHPGYFNRSILFNFINRSRFGPWEHRRTSSAFVPFRFRKQYVCGGVFWGVRDSFKQLCITLKNQIDSDISRGVLAKHNDESHLNSWFYRNRTSAASPVWAYASGYKNLKGLSPKIHVIHKPSSFVRAPTNHF